MNWYLQSGKDSDVVNSTRIRLVRNLVGFPFEIREKKQREELENKIKDHLYEIGYGLQFFQLKDMDDMTKMSLVEKNLMTPEFALDKKQEGSILINEEENICIMVGGKDHLRIQVFSSGLELENTLNLAIELDQKIEETLNYATSAKYGYLTSSPSDCGTGLKASVMLHLPGLLKTGNREQVFETIGKFGVNIRGTYGENSKTSGDLFQISNQITLGVTEKEICEKIQVITDKLKEQERKARKFLAQDPIELEDIIYRSYGILKQCRKIGIEEASQLISNVKMGVDLGILKEVTDLKIQKLYYYTKPATLQKELGEQYEALEREIKRAEKIHQILEEK